ncbi:hypothetical protein [Bacillus toyonensis]|uniref:hypothetical protein n=1 Tax=Bacillus toyonensis TaxID=155322 RepID=UPI002E1C0489|nr:hypothetical protein [Bacillus toyonensis]
MEFIEKMSNEKLLKEFEWMINRLRSYNTNEQEEYKEKLKAEIQKRMNSNN